MHRELLVFSVVFAACAVPNTPTDGGEIIEDAGIGDPNVFVGCFKLTHVVSTFGDSASFAGKIYDGATPSTLLWTTSLESGDCRVEIPSTPFCSTPCGSSAACVATDTCMPYPSSKSAGTIHVSGVSSSSGTAFDITPVLNGYQAPAGTTLNLPPFIEGTDVTVAANSFSLTAKGVAPIALAQTSYALQTGTSLLVDWTKGSENVPSKIELEIDISHHGGIKGKIVCETEDDGSIRIDGSLIDRLISLGVSGFPSITVQRRANAWGVISAGRVDLDIISSTEVGVTVPGLTSCTDDTQCPSGQTCQDDLKCK